jgi:phosphoribosylformylglycinamidine (FGAM) synthase-like enzyme
MGQIPDVGNCVSMDLKSAGNLLYLVGLTKNEMGGSHFHLVEKATGGAVPTVDTTVAKATFAAIHAAINAGTIRACHDLSEGGLAVAAAEMCFAGGLGASINLADVPTAENATDAEVRLFSESNTRLLCEVPVDLADRFEQLLAGVPCARVGVVESDPKLIITGESVAVAADVADLKEAWQAPLRWE